MAGDQLSGSLGVGLLGARRGWLSGRGGMRVVLPVEGPCGVRLVVAAAAVPLCVSFGAADDEQQRQVEAPSAGHRAPPAAPPGAGRVRPAVSWCAEAVWTEGRAGGGPVDSRSRSGRRPDGGRGCHPAAEAGTESPQMIDDNLWM